MRLTAPISGDGGSELYPADPEWNRAEFVYRAVILDGLVHAGSRLGAGSTAWRRGWRPKRLARAPFAARNGDRVWCIIRPRIHMHSRPSELAESTQDDTSMSGRRILTDKQIV